MAQDTFPIDKVRAQFPALKQPQVFLDNAGGSQALGTVITSISDYLTKTNVQLGASYTSSKLSTDLYNKGYAAAARYINAPETSIVIGASTTQLFRNLSFALSFPSGSEIIISKLDHEANIASWVAIAERQNLVVKWWLPDADHAAPNPRLTPESLAPLLSPRTVFVSCTHASNILGSIHPIAQLADLIHTQAPGALFCVDAVAYAPHRPLDMVALGVDFYAFSWYKVYGPHVAQLYASPSALKKVSSLGHYFNGHESLAEKLGLAGSSYELVAAIPAVVGYLDDAEGVVTGNATGGKTFWTKIADHEAKLATILLDYLTTNEKVTILGEPTPDPLLRVPTISFVVKGMASRDVVEAVDRASGHSSGAQTRPGEDGDMGRGESRQFGIRWGHFYSKRLCEEVLGLDKDGQGVIRVSMVHYNSVDEVRALVDALRSVIG